MVPELSGCSRIEPSVMPCPGCVSSPSLMNATRREDEFEVGQFEVGAAAHEPVRLGDVGAEHAAAAHQVVGDLRQAARGEERVVLGFDDESAEQVVLEVLADLGGGCDDLDSVRGELLGIADARQHEQLRGVDRTAGEDHFAAGGDRAPGSALDVLDPGGALSVEGAHG